MKKNIAYPKMCNSIVRLPDESRDLFLVSEKYDNMTIIPNDPIFRYRRECTMTSFFHIIIGNKYGNEYTLYYYVGEPFTDYLV
jgi:hypothetical protein